MTSTLRFPLALPLIACLGAALLACEPGDEPPPPDSFERFTLEFSAGLCEPDDDCAEFIEVNADGSVMYDAYGEVPVVVHEATISTEDLDALIPTLTDSALVDILSLSEAPCDPPTDIGESMTLVADGVTYQNSTTSCQDAPLVAAREALESLAAEYFPGL